MSSHRCTECTQTTKTLARYKEEGKEGSGVREGWMEGGGKEGSEKGEERRKQFVLLKK